MSIQTVPHRIEVFHNMKSECASRHPPVMEDQKQTKCRVLKTMLFVFFWHVVKSITLWPIALGTWYFQNGDPILVKWGPKRDPRQQNGDPKRHTADVPLKNWFHLGSSFRCSQVKGKYIAIVGWHLLHVYSFFTELFTEYFSVFLINNFALRNWGPKLSHQPQRSRKAMDTFRASLSPPPTSTAVPT